MENSDPTGISLSTLAPSECFLPLISMPLMAATLSPTQTFEYLEIVESSLIFLIKTRPFPLSHSVTPRAGMSFLILMRQGKEYFICFYATLPPSMASIFFCRITWQCRCNTTLELAFQLYGDGARVLQTTLASLLLKQRNNNCLGSIEKFAQHARAWLCWHRAWARSCFGVRSTPIIPSLAVCCENDVSQLACHCAADKVWPF